MKNEKKEYMNYSTTRAPIGRQMSGDKWVDQQMKGNGRGEHTTVPKI